MVGRYPQKPRCHNSKTYRSGLEEKVAVQLQNLQVPFTYEEYVIEFKQPEKKRKYTPDFILTNSVIIETKGIFDTADRQKHLWIQEQHPELDIRFVFSNSRSKLRKGSPTSYAMWCEKNGFQYADKLIPLSWLKENRPCLSSVNNLKKKKSSSTSEKGTL